MRKACEKKIEAIVREEGQQVLGWRTPPINESSLGQVARTNRPYIRQLFIGRSGDLDGSGDLAFERRLFLIRRRCEHLTAGLSESGGDYFYFASLSSRTLVYKGMLTPGQIDAFYLDLTSLDMESSLALVHSRYSTNTFPSWERAHPYRYLIHNGEINTIRGNLNWMHARQSTLQTDLFGPDLGRIFPLINANGSDSAMFDNCLEFLTLTGRSMPHAAMMMVPEPWSKHESMSDDVKAFYEYHSTLMEPWDGPAAMAFTDGVQVCAILDRNGLRPARYTVTRDGLVILASEAGVLNIPPEQILSNDRLRPGRMLVIDTATGRIVDDGELKRQLAAEKPYRQWLQDQMLCLDDLPAVPVLPDQPESGGQAAMRPELSLEQREKAFGYTWEDVHTVIEAMARNGIEPVGSMGTDAPLAVLSDRPQLLGDYFKQMFAQVTNPPIDAQREDMVTSTESYIGSDGNLIHPGPENCRQIRIRAPIIDNDQLARLKQISQPGFQAAVLPVLFPEAGGGAALEQALADLFAAADQAIGRGINILVLSDRDVGPGLAPIPVLLATAGLHHHLVRQQTRTRVSLIVESGEPREVHHFALLAGYGASAVNPYLAFEIVGDLARQGRLDGMSEEESIGRYIKAAVKGIVKIMAKMGISTIQSYQGAQFFEAVGIHPQVVDRYFTATPSRVGGIGLAEIAGAAACRLQTAFDPNLTDRGLESSGRYQWRSDGEYHLFNPLTVHNLQQAVRTGDYQLFKTYSASLDDAGQRLCTLRGLLDFVPAGPPVPLAEVEPVERLVRRFKTGAMSYGSISQEAHETLAVAMNRLGGRSNTGEGGEDARRYILSENGDSRNSAIKQVASGRFGVTSEYLVQAGELQIKMAQGAKPGEGGQLPGRKVYPWIAATRHATPGVGLISPPPHHDIYSIEDLAELIHDLKNANDQARISVKLVSEAGVGTIAAGVAKGRADVVLISGYDGGTGASPITSIRHAGLPWELGLAETHQTLLLNDLRSRIVVETDGKLLTGRDVAVAALLGAEEFGFATGPLVALGCVMMRVCNLDTCPVGIATQNPDLRRRFAGKPEYVENFMRFIAEELREIMAGLGFRTVNEMVGRTDCLQPLRAIDRWRHTGLDLSALLYRPAVGSKVGHYCQFRQEHGLERSMDQQVLLPICQSALRRRLPVQATLPIRNINRVTGTRLGSEITRRYGAAGLPDDTIRLTFVGSAGQSFGAFLPPGLTLILEGEANDYIGKGLSGGKIIVRPDHRSAIPSQENVIAGNVAFYGATGGEAYIRGAAGERFCVRNSGLSAVVEGVGDHGCEYMTGGRVVILGATGRNFAAGMSGGIAYVLDIDGRFGERCNTDMADIAALVDTAEIAAVKLLIEKHEGATGSTYARSILDDWADRLPLFRKVIPRDYQRMLKTLQDVRAQGLTGDDALMAAFISNNRDKARVSGN